MNSEEITSPVPVFPSGSNVTASIPLLEETQMTTSATDKTDTPAINSEVSNSAIPAEDTQRIPDEAGATVLHPSPSMNTTLPRQDIANDAVQPDRGIVVVDDAVVEVTAPSDMSETSKNSGNPPPASSHTEPNIPIEPSIESKPDQEQHEESRQAPSSSSQMTVPDAQIQPSAGLPSGVDLQALLNSFANTAPSAPSVPEETPVTDTQPVEPVRVASKAENIESSNSKPIAPWHNAPRGPAASMAQTTSEDSLYEQFLVDEKRIMGNTAPHEFEPGSRLFVGNLSTETTSKREIFLIFRKYGKLAQVSLKSTYGFVQFLSARECRNALGGEQGIEIGKRKLHLEVSKPQPVRGAQAQSSSRRRSRSPVRRPASISYGRDSHDSHRRASPPRRNSPGRYHTPYDAPYPPPRRSPSPRAGPPMQDILLPQRFGSQVPDVQIVVIDEADRAYIHWVETSVRQAGLRVETLFLSARLSLQAVVRQMVKEGVLAIIQCDRQLQMTNKVSLQVFDRSRGAQNVRFDEYAGLDMATAIGLLNRTRQQAAIAPVANPPPPPQQANLAAMIAQMDPASLQQVIGALSQQQQQQSHHGAYPGTFPYKR